MSPGVLQVWENVGIQVIMGLSTGIPMARRLPPPIMGPTGIPMHPSGWDSLDAYIPLATDKVPVDPENSGVLQVWENVGIQVITFLPLPTSLSGAMPLATSSHP